jgi:hypothetical protein
MQNSKVFAALPVLFSGLQNVSSTAPFLADSKSLGFKGNKCGETNVLGYIYTLVIFHPGTICQVTIHKFHFFEKAQWSFKQ